MHTVLSTFPLYQKPKAEGPTLPGILFIAIEFPVSSPKGLDRIKVLLSDGVNPVLRLCVIGAVGAKPKALTAPLVGGAEPLVKGETEVCGVSLNHRLRIPSLLGP